MGADEGVRGGLAEEEEEEGGRLRRWPVSRGEERERGRTSICRWALS